jgi:SAM-dependent methyltransferase
MTERYLAANQRRWNALTPLHAASAYYDLDAFKAGGSSLHAIEREQVGDVAGKSLLHLQCHFGMDTLSWARLGARVTGVDFSGEAIALARELSADLAIPAQFVQADVLRLPETLLGRENYAIVFTSYGVLCWLPDLRAWGRTIAHYLRPGGLFCIVEGHPLAGIFDNEGGATSLRVTHPYFHAAAPEHYESQGSYATGAGEVLAGYEWAHSLSDIINALTGAGLDILSLQEYPIASWRRFPFMIPTSDGWWRLPDHLPALPLTFALRATKKPSGSL